MEATIVIARYSKRHNAVAERKLFTMNDDRKALDYIMNTKKPLMYYIDGTQNLDCFFRFFMNKNNEYKKEYKKIID